jgi:hypothetical protein
MDQKYYGVYAAMATLPGPESAAVKLNDLMQKVAAVAVLCGGGGEERERVCACVYV